MADDYYIPVNAAVRPSDGPVLVIARFIRELVPHRLKLRITLGAVAVIGLLATGTASVQAWYAERTILVNMFDDRTGDIAVELRVGIESALQVLDDLAIAEQSAGLDRAQFELYSSQSAAQHPILLGLSWIPRVPTAERPRIEHQTEEEGFTGFQITEQDANGRLIRAQPRSEYFPVLYALASDSSSPWLGFDLASSPLRERALVQADATDRVAATSPIVLFAESGRTGGFLALRAVRDGAAARAPDGRQPLRGYVQATFANSALVDDILGLQLIRDMHLEIADVTDVSDGSGGAPVYSSPNAAVGPVLDVADVEVAGRTWRLSTSAANATVLQPPVIAPLMVLVAGFVVTLLLMMLLALGLQRQRRLVAQAEARAIYEAAAENLVDGLTVCDREERVIVWNPRLAELWGITTEDALGRQLGTLLLRVSKQVVQAESFLRDEAEAAAMAHASRTGAISYRLDGQVPRDLKTVVFPILGPSGYVGQGRLVRDMTREEETARLKDELIGVVSHELRTPIASLVGFTELLLNRTYSEDRRREFLSIMLLEGRRLTGLINDFLDLQRMENRSWSIAPTPIDLSSTIARAVAVAGEDATRPIVAELPPDMPLIQGDEARFQQVIGNLLGNARKYSPAGGEIRVSAQVVGRMVTVEVRDHGLGLPADSVGKLFSKFYRVDNSDRRAIKGTGLGLAICRKIVEAHGGSIWAESRGLGQGSAFSFTVPIAAAVPSPNASVLIVEDNDAFARLLEEELTARGQSSARATSAEEGWERLAALTPGVLLLDLKLPGVSGQTFLRRVREEGNATLPVVIVTMLDLTPSEELDLAQLGALVLRKSHTSAATAAALAISLVSDQPGDLPAPSMADTDDQRRAA